MTIRPATPADAPAIHALLTLLAAFEGGAVKAAPADLERDLAAGLFAALLAEKDGRAVGVLTHFPTYSSWLGRPGVMIHDLFVVEPARGRGIGEALVAALADLANENGWARMDVNVVESNAAGRRFYERMGLAPTEGWLGYRIEGEPLRREL